MTCYDETRDRDELFPPRPRNGPTVIRDGQNVREIAEDPAAFIGHVRPRMKHGRDDGWRNEE
jgi:hypothetical protein